MKTFLIRNKLDRTKNYNVNSKIHNVENILNDYTTTGKSKETRYRKNFTLHERREF